MVRFTVYALIDSRDGSIFYIGATKSELEKRLYQHKTAKERQTKKWSTINNRVNKIREILSSGGDVLIKKLKTCGPDKVDYYEEKYYNLYVKNGFELIQHRSHFNLSQKRWLDVEMMRFAYRLDVVTNKRFEYFCESLHLQPSTALRILLTEALNSRNIP